MSPLSWLQVIKGLLRAFDKERLEVVVLDDERCINHSLIRKIIARGTPQGGVLSPLSWLLVITGILRAFENERLEGVVNAYNVIILVGGYILSSIADLVEVEGALRKLPGWAGANGLGIKQRET